MRHTLTLDEDVDAALAEACRTSGKPYKEVVNTILRQGLVVRESIKHAPKLKIEPVAMGLREGLSLTSVSALEELLDGEKPR